MATFNVRSMSLRAVLTPEWGRKGFAMNSSHVAASAAEGVSLVWLRDVVYDVVKALVEGTLELPVMSNGVWQPLLITGTSSCWEKPVLIAVVARDGEGWFDNNTSFTMTRRGRVMVKMDEEGNKTARACPWLSAVRRATEARRPALRAAFVAAAERSVARYAALAGARGRPTCQEFSNLEAAERLLTAAKGGW